MMTFAHPEMNAVLKFGSGEIVSLVIENSRFFRSIVSDIYTQINGGAGSAVLSIDNAPKDLAKYADMIESPISFSINTKTMQSRILAALERNAVDESFYMRTGELMRAVEQYFIELTQDYTADLYCSKLNISSLLKSLGVSIREEYSNQLEKYIDYMELTREFDRDRLFVFVNLRSFFSDKELLPFLETVSAHEYKILMIDNMAQAMLPREKRLIIDKDLCEIVI